MGYTLVQLPKGGTQPAEQPKKRYRLIAPPQQQEVNSAAKADRPMSGGDMAMDILKAGGAGLGRGVIQTLGAPGDMREGAAAVAGLISPEVGQAVRQGISTAIPGFNAMPGSQMLGHVNDATRPAPDVSQLVTGEQPQAPLEYQGNSEAAQIVGRGAEFIPGAIGPGGPIRKAAMVLLPAAGSEIAGQLTKGTAYEPAARAAGAFGGGMMAAGRIPNAMKQLAKGAPSREAVSQATNQMYDKLRNAGIQYDVPSFDLMATNLMRRLNREGFRKAQAPKTADTLEYIGEFVGKGLDFNDLDSIRKTAGAVARSAEPTERKAAGMVLEALDDFAQRSPFSTNGSLMPGQAKSLMKDAREMARRNIIARDIEDMTAKAETYQSGNDSGLRNQFANYLRSKKAKSLTPVERQAFMDAAKGNFTTNALRTLGRFGFDFGRLGNVQSLVPAIGGIAAGSIDPTLGVATAAVGTAAKYAGRRMSENLARRAEGVALSGRDAQRAVSGRRNAIAYDVLLRRFLAGEAAHRQIEKGRAGRAVE